MEIFNTLFWRLTQIGASNVPFIHKLQEEYMGLFIAHRLIAM